ncbi:MAG: 4Fe-4S binding protein [Thermosulfidibacteraceae bacterium]|jgi:pyruvate ferredoxin oxidoreductase delta subunit
MRKLPTWKELTLAGIITEAGNSVEYKTGNWRTLTPVVNYDECIKCGVCWSFCPEYAWEEGEDSFFKLNTDYCKGCGICAVECPRKCIKMVEL